MPTSVSFSCPNVICGERAPNAALESKTGAAESKNHTEIFVWDERKIQKIKMISITEASRKTALSKSTLLTMCGNGKIPGAEMVVNKIWTIPRQWAEEWASSPSRDIGSLEGFRPLAEAVKMAGVSRVAMLAAIERGDVMAKRQERVERAYWWVNTDDPSFEKYKTSAQIRSARAKGTKPS